MHTLMTNTTQTQSKYHVHKTMFASILTLMKFVPSERLFSVQCSYVLISSEGDHVCLSWKPLLVFWNLSIINPIKNSHPKHSSLLIRFLGLLSTQDLTPVLVSITCSRSSCNTGTTSPLKSSFIRKSCIGFFPHYTDQQLSMSKWS